MASQVVAGQFDRPPEGPRLRRQSSEAPSKFSKLAAWQSTGSTAGAWLEIALPTVTGSLTKFFLVGWFPSLHAVLGKAEDDMVMVEFSANEPNLRATSLSDIGPEDSPDPVLVEIECPPTDSVGSIVVRFPVGSSATVFEVFAQFESPATCPFHGNAPGVSLEQLAAVVRVGDRVRFCKALDQLRASILAVHGNLDEAKGLGLTFLSVIVSALLEHGAPREMHSLLLNAARKLDPLTTHEEVVDLIVHLCEQCTANLMRSDSTATSLAIDRALQMVEREFAKPMTDEQVANAVGLSTSHFRYLFRQVTGQPFHKYLLSMRLEKAKRLLTDTDASVAEAASRCGFASPAHFSRAFSARFQATPSGLRNARN